ncbi:MAG: sugar ABC transporter substrate-binding protein, partial [Oscillospiraceae bacterium]|nr:sugar ABC transporter substrate-binding protein [Oscillospiraceae bacterium]
EGWKTFIDLIPYSLARPADVKYPEVSTGYQMALQEALTLSKTPEEALKDGQAMIDAALAK